MGGVGAVEPLQPQLWRGRGHSSPGLRGAVSISQHTDHVPAHNSGTTTHRLGNVRPLLVCVPSHGIQTRRHVTRHTDQTPPHMLDQALRYTAHTCHHVAHHTGLAPRYTAHR